MSEPDLLEQWKGQVQEMSRNLEAVRGRADRGRRRQQAAETEAADAAERENVSRRTVELLSGALDSARSRLEKMHVPGCLRAGWDCPACEGLDELDAYGV